MTANFTVSRHAFLLLFDNPILNDFEDGTVVTAEELYAKGFIGNLNTAVKILGDGELEKKLTVKANKFSESAKQKIEAAGGKVEVL